MTSVDDDAPAPEVAPHLLIVDDDSRLRAVLKRYLVKNGFLVTEASDARDARAKLKSLEFDLLILDVMMPGETGFELLSHLRKETRVPVLMLTAMSEPSDRINGLERGADDYLPKPFEPRELVLRLRNILARVPPPAAPVEPVAILRLGDCALDLKRGELTRNGALVHLTAGEAALLMALANRAGEPVSREALSAYSQFSGNERTVDVQITRLRRKIERDQKYPRYLQTVRGTGYVLKPD
ncbi:MAG TPA: response regulator transcription factor [Aliidongia sp.]|uniref:response regulator transcription factor n=1 Tax=Aliidongia sp. TaxID=1914230 RepID=UPI002DDD9E25|nr:response regulator transcription factor [Aliidongia sp.]HEV2675719.1 response regulator transcription factor [Aliidongia sp.]